MIDHAHIHPDVRDVCTRSMAERIAFLREPRWIDYPVAREILETLRALMGRPARPRMQNLLLVGEPGSGKTTILRRFFELHGQGYVNKEVRPVKPVILTGVPANANERGLYAAVLECFWAPYRGTDPIAKLRYQVIHQLRDCHTRVLVIDGIDALLTGSTTQRQVVMNTIKFLGNELMIPIVGAGTRQAARVLNTDPQLVSRFDAIRLPPWSLNKVFERFLASFEQMLPLREPSRLSQPELAFALHSRCAGNLGRLHRLLTECAIVAIESGVEHIDLDIMGIAEAGCAAAV